MDKDELWGKTLAIMLDGVGEDDAKHFFLGQLHPLGIFGDQFILLTNNEQVESWVRRNYLGEISAAALAASGVAYTVQIAGNPAAQASQTAAAQPSAAVPNAQPAAQPVADSAPVFSVPSFVDQPAPQPEQKPVPEWMNARVQMSDLPGQKPQPAQQAQQAAASSGSSGGAVIRNNRSLAAKWAPSRP